MSANRTRALLLEEDPLLQDWTEDQDTEDAEDANEGAGDDGTADGAEGAGGAPPRGPEVPSDAPAEASQEPPERKPDGLSGDGSLADLKQQMELARLLFPDMREVPGEVVMAMADGGGFLQAYAAYRARETRRLRQENEELRRQRNHLAPVRGVTGGGGVRNRAVSDFERGFDADGW